MAVTQLGLSGYGTRREGSFADKVSTQIGWTLVLNFDPTWIGNSRSCVAVSGYLMSQGEPIAPWLPAGTQ